MSTPRPQLPKRLQRLRANPDIMPLTLKPPKKIVASAHSKDINEDRGVRQMKTSQNPQTFPHENQPHP
jgi:hypothetical protein